MKTQTLRERLEKIMNEQYPDKLFSGFYDKLGSSYGRGQTVNRILSLIQQEIRECIPKELQENYKPLSTIEGMAVFQHNNLLSIIQTKLKEKGIL